MEESTSIKEKNRSGIHTEKDNALWGLGKLFLSKWWIFLLVGIFSCVAGFLYSFYQKPMYESRLSFSLDAGASDGTLSSAMNLAAQFGLGIGSGQNMFDGDNILEIMKSRRMVEKVLLSVDTFGGKPFTLAQYYLEKSGLKNQLDKSKLKNINFPAGFGKDGLSYLQDSILYNLYLEFSKNNMVATRPDKKLSIYEVRIKTIDEKFSKVFTDRIVEATDNFYIEITSKKDKETLKILEQRVASLKGNVGSSIDVRASNQDANTNPAFAAAQSPLLKEQYNMQAYGEAYKEMFKTLEMARYQYLKKIPLLQIIDHADYPMQRIKIGKLKSAIYFFTILVLITAIVMAVINNSRRRF